jgi:hypothetical protein
MDCIARYKFHTPLPHLPATPGATWDGKWIALRATSFTPPPLLPPPDVGAGVLETSGRTPPATAQAGKER